MRLMVFAFDQVIKIVPFARLDKKGFFCLITAHIHLSKQKKSRSPAKLQQFPILIKMQI